MDAARVIVVEDNTMTRTLVAGVLASHGFDVVGSCASTAEAMDVIESQTIDVAVIDLHLGRGPTGIDLARTLSIRFPEIAVVILTSYSDPRLLSDDLQTSDLNLQYLLKKDIGEASVLIAAIQRALDGEDSSVASELKLTRSQISTLRMMAEGMSNAAIARERAVSERAVEDTIRRLAHRFGIESGDGANVRALLLREYYRLIGAPGAG